MSSSSSRPAHSTPTHTGSLAPEDPSFLTYPLSSALLSQTTHPVVNGLDDMSTVSSSYTHAEASSRRNGDSASGSSWVRSIDVSCCQHNDEMEEDSDEYMDDASDNEAQPYRLTAAQRKYHGERACPIRRITGNYVRRTRS